MELPPNPMSGIDEGATRALGTHRARATLLDTQSPKAAHLESAASAGPAAYEVFKQWVGMDPMKDGPLILPLDWLRPPPVSAPTDDPYPGNWVNRMPTSHPGYDQWLAQGRQTAINDRYRYHYPNRFYNTWGVQMSSSNAFTYGVRGGESNWGWGSLQ